MRKSELPCALPQAAIILCDREGKKLSEGRSDPFAASLNMGIEFDGIKVEMWAFCSPYSNGSASCKVWDAGKLVYEGGGQYFSLGAGCKPTVYKPGPWEAKILNRARPYFAERS